MKQLKRYTICGIIFVLVTGTLAHFLYGWTGNNYIVGFFTPMNESIWEHMKLLFFPMLLYVLIVAFKFKKTCSCITSSFCFGILIGTLLIPIFFYTYTFIIGKNIFVLDIGTFILSVIIAFWLSYKFTLSCKLEPYAFLSCCLVFILFICFILFTYHPPETEIFADPTVLGSFGQNLFRNWKKEFFDKASIVFDDTREDNLKEKLAVKWMLAIKPSKLRRLQKEWIK